MDLETEPLGRELFGMHVHRRRLLFVLPVCRCKRVSVEKWLNEKRIKVVQSSIVLHNIYII
jgi:hypothetical protein